MNSHACDGYSMPASGSNLLGMMASTCNMEPASVETGAQRSDGCCLCRPVLAMSRLMCTMYMSVASCRLVICERFVLGFLRGAPGFYDHWLLGQFALLVRGASRGRRLAICAGFVLGFLREVPGFHDHWLLGQFPFPSHLDVPTLFMSVARR